MRNAISHESLAIRQKNKERGKIAAIGTVLAKVGKKLLTVLLGDKKGRKTLLYVTGITLVITFLPLILVLGLFGWMAGGGTDNMITPGAVYNELPNEIQVELTRHEEAF